MKKNFKYAFMSAIAFAGAVCFSACSSSDEIVDNPNFNSETNTVTTQFILNVDYAQQTPTRQSAATVQRDFSATSGKNFRGIKDAKLIALGTGKSTWLAPFDGSATTGDGYVKKIFTLGTLYSNNAVDNLTPTGETNSNNYGKSSHRVLQLELPVTADAMLVYGRAIPSGNIEEDGKVVAAINDNPESSTFDLVSRLKGLGSTEFPDNSGEYNQTLNLAALILTRIMVSEVKATTGTYTFNGYTSSSTLSELQWKTISGAGNGLPHTLRQAYDKIKIKAGEKRNGSAKAVLELILDLYKTIDGVLQATATDDSEVNAQRLAYEIEARISKYFTVNLTATPNTVVFKPIGATGTSATIKYSLCGGATPIVDEVTFNSQYGSVTDNDLAGFPGSFGLPEGTAILKQNEDDSFVYRNTTNDNDNSLLGSGDLSADKYMYPAELLYFDNSALYVSDADKKESDYPNGYNTWNTYGWTINGWTQGAVSSSTKSVAVKSNINYGVAMLQTKVGFADATSYVDNRNHITGEADQTFTPGEMANFKLTGVLVGNQYKQVKWNYITSETAATSPDYVIYDKAISTSFDIPTSAGNENYTLVFDNWAKGDAQTSDVYVALEFKNNAKDFFGNENLIPYGGTFYLVGKLTLANGTGKEEWDADATYATPPYTSGATTEVDRVFIQNYMTTATFNIGATSLQKAFLTVPDLRSTQMSLGLSVDLSWRQGLTFTSLLGE